MLRFETHFLLQLAIQSLFRALGRIATPLGELPGILADALGPQHLTAIV